MRAHSENALALATMLEADDRVEWVRYPGLASHPQHVLAATLLPDGYGGMLSLRLHGGVDAMSAFIEGVGLGGIAVRLGDVTTLVYPMSKRDSLVRVSVGCEDIDDLLTGFGRALARVGAAAPG